MKRNDFTGLSVQVIPLFFMLSLASTSLWAAHSGRATRKIEKVVFGVLGRDAIKATEIEIVVKEELLKNGVSSNSLRIVAKDQEADVGRLIEFIKSEGYDSVLCMGPRGSILITPKDKAGGFSSLQDCLSTYMTGNYPSGEPLEVEPFVTDGPPTRTTATQGTQRTPIPTNPTAVSQKVFKGTLRVFDAPTSAVIWEGSLSGKVAADMRSTLESKMMADSVMKALKKSGLLPDQP